MNCNKMYQVSTLQALAMGYMRPVVTISELMSHGNTGLGTFTDVNGEMIVVDGHCYQADVHGNVMEPELSTGVSFSSVSFLHGDRHLDLIGPLDVEGLKSHLTVLVEEGFGLNSMHMVRIDGSFAEVHARSEVPYHTQHKSLKDILAQTQKDFLFQNIYGTLICVYFPDYMDGINAPGWHLHFVSEDRSRGGHVFRIMLREGKAVIDKIQQIEIQLPTDPAFDTYSLKEASNDDIKQVEQGAAK